MVTLKHYTIACQSTRRYIQDNKQIQNDAKIGNLQKIGHLQQKSLWPVSYESLNTGSQRIRTKGP